MTIDTGSYVFDNYGKQDVELKMLERQADVARQFELSILQDAGLKPDMNVLDMGCGAGATTLLIAEYVKKGSVTGVDASEVLIAHAEALKKTSGCGNAKFKTGDIYSPCLPEGCFDFVYCRLLFQHLRTPVKALQVLYRLLKPGGTVCVVDVDDACFFLSPEPEKLGSMVSRAASAQNAEGGDRLVGRKLPSYLHAAGFRDADAQIRNLYSRDIGMKMFLHTAVDFRVERLPACEAEIAGEELNDVYKILNLPYAWGALGLFIATGRK